MIVFLCWSIGEGKGLNVISVWKRCLNCQMLPYLTASSAVDGQGQSCVRWANDVLLELPVFPQHAHGKPVDGTAGLLWWDSPGEKTEGPEGISWAETGRVVRSMWRLLVWLPRHPHYGTGALPTTTQFKDDGVPSLPPSSSVLSFNSVSLRDWKNERPQFYF